MTITGKLAGKDFMLHQLRSGSWQCDLYSECGQTYRGFGADAAAARGDAHDKYLKFKR